MSAARVLDPLADLVPPLIFRAITLARMARSAALLPLGTSGYSMKANNSAANFSHRSATTVCGGRPSLSRSR